MRASTITRSISTEVLRLDQLAVLSVSQTKAGKIRSVIDYVDTSTGKVIPAEQLNIPVLDLREKLPARRKALESLRPEPRRFASFVLSFANKRRGITPGIDTLCRWYGDMHGRRSQDVRRYIGALTDAGILAGENLLGPLFQRTGGASRQHLGEEFHAWSVYTRMRSDMRAELEASACQQAHEVIRRAAGIPEAVHA